LIRRLTTFIGALFGALAAMALAHGDLHEAIEAVSAAIAASPDDGALFLRRAELRRRHGEWAAAEEDYARASQLQPGLEVVKLGLAQIRFAQGREPEALRLLDDFLRQRPDHPAARAARADILEKRGDWRKADADLAAAVAASPEPHYATMRAALLERHGDPDAAARSLDKACRAHGRVPLLEAQALDIEERAGRTAAALRRLDGFIAREPRADLWLARKARLLAKAGRAEEARGAWREAAAAFSKLPADRRDSRPTRKLAAEIAAGVAGESAKSR
jgi:predicted Zn-dependent protease